MQTEAGATQFAKGLAAVLGVATAIYSTWLTILAFVGGTAPGLGWEFEGSFGQGLLWLFIIEPLAITAAYWISMAIVLPFAALGAAQDAKRQRRD